MYRTTIRLNPHIKRQATKLAAETGRSFTAIVEEALVRLLGSAKRPGRRRRAKLPSARLGPPNLPIEELNRTNQILLDMDMADYHRVSADIARRSAKRKRA